MIIVNIARIFFPRVNIVLVRVRDSVERRASGRFFFFNFFRNRKRFEKRKQRCTRVRPSPSGTHRLHYGIHAKRSGRVGFLTSKNVRDRFI